MAQAGPSSQRTDLVISEIMYTAASGSDWVELRNTGPRPMDISGYRIQATGTGTGLLDFTFANGTTLAVGAFVTRDGALPDTQGTLRVYGSAGELLLEVEYSNTAPWPAHAGNGVGHSLVLAKPSYGEADVRAWAASEYIGGSKGVAEPAFDATHHLVINEFLANPSGGSTDFIEIYNAGPTTVDISGCTLGDGLGALATRDRYTIPAGTTVPAGGFIVFAEPAWGSWGLGASGEDAVFSNPVSAPSRRIVDAHRFGLQLANVPMGRYPDGATGMKHLTAESRTAANNAALVQDIVINEIMYNPITGDDNDEYIELYNRGSTAVNVSGWVVVVGNSSDNIPNNTPAIPANGYLVLANDATHLRTKYAPGLDTITVVDSVIPGTLANRGERVALMNGTLIVDEVTFGDGGRWGQWADGGGSSLELIDPTSDNSLAANWSDSDETGKHNWHKVTFTGDFLNGYLPKEYANGWIYRSGPAYLEVAAMGAGEFLLDDVQVTYGGQPYLSGDSRDFDGGTLGGWQLEGNHDLSFLDNTWGAHPLSISLRVASSGTGHYLCNRLRVPLSGTLPPNAQGVSVTAWVRWLRGTPDLVFRFEGNYLEKAVDMRTLGGLDYYGNPSVGFPAKLGTPGAINSRNVAHGGNAGPAIANVSHNPPLPGANQAVTVTADISDPNGLSNVKLWYRIDSPSPQAWTSINMSSVGGRWSGVIPGQASGNIVAFYIQATDNTSVNPRTSRFPVSQKLYPTDTEQRVCLVAFGEVSSTASTRFPEYHFWMTTATREEWESPAHALLPNRSQAHNGYLDLTFVSVRGSETRVIYNAGGRYGSSVAHNYAFTTPVNGGATYGINFPKDDPFLGTDDFVLDKGDYQLEQIAFWTFRRMKLFYNHRKYVHVYFNRTYNGVYEDTQQPSGEAAAEWSPNDNEGGLYKFEVLFDSVSAAGISDFDRRSPLANYLRGSAKDLGGYRWKALKRAVGLSAHDYSDLFQLVDAVNLSTGDPLYNSAVESVMDVDQWMRVVALLHIISATDSYGYSVAHHNMYAYKPENGSWQLWPYDLDGLFSQDPSTDLFSFSIHYPPSTTLNVDDPFLPTIPQRHPFARAYLRALYDAISPGGPLAVDGGGNLADLQAFVTANATALSQNGVSGQTGPADLFSYLSQRRTQIISQIGQYTEPAVAFGVTSPADNTQVPSLTATITGTAPVPVKTVKVNGVAYPATWTSRVNWSIQVPLVTGPNPLAIAAFDAAGTQVGLTQNRNVIAPVFAITSPTDFATVSTLSVTLAGTAPTDMVTLEVNNTPVAFTWISPNVWSAQVPLVLGENALSIRALNSTGGQIGTTQNKIIISEILHSLNEQFSVASNPSPDGRWRFGYKTSSAGPGGAFNLVTVQHSSPVGGGINIPSWQLTSGSGPAFYFNNSGTTFSVNAGGNVGEAIVLPTDVWFQPGENGASQRYGVIRYTVPTGEQGRYQIEAHVQAFYLNASVGDTRFLVYHNSTQLYDNNLAAAGSAGFVRVRNLVAGNTIDFIIDRGPDASAYASSLSIRAFLRKASSTGTTIGTAYSPNANFSASANPHTSDRWRYGYVQSFGLPFNLVTVPWNSTIDGGVNVPSWQLTSGLEPAFYRIASSGTVTANIGGTTYKANFVPQTMWFYPGQNAQPQNYGVIRYTVPSADGAGLYSIGAIVESVWLTLNDGDSDFHILKNGVPIGNVDIVPGGSAMYGRTLQLAVGDTVDFAIGRGADGDAYASGLKIWAEIVKLP